MRPKPPRHIKIGLCGMGTVGQAVLALFNRNQTEIAERTGVALHISHLGMRTPKPELDTSAYRCSANVLDVAEDPEVAILIEAIGGETTAKTLILKAISHGKHVVTANKAVMALHGEEIMAAARAAGVLVRFEAAVAGGIPIIKTICEGLIANRIRRIIGIINGTTNYILSTLAGGGGQSMDEALKAAQQAGYAESDPSFDVDGIDCAHKITILAALGLNIPLAYEQVYIEGIARITAADITHAQEYGYRIKHLGIAVRGEQGFELRVHPALIPLHHPLAAVSGAMNAVSLQADATGTTIYYGAGAGGTVTASAVLADVADILRDTASPEQTAARAQIRLFPDQAKFSQPMLSINEISTRHYLRLDIKDHPGVLSTVTQALSEAQIDVEEVKQNSTPYQDDSDADWKSLVLITHPIQNQNIQQALKTLRSLADVNRDIQHIRIIEDD